MRYLAIYLALLTSCVPNMGQADLDYEKGHAAATLALVTTQDTPAVPDKPVGDKCLNCNGTGKVGDGRVFVECPECDGTGKRTTTPPETKAASRQQSTIIFYSGPNCAVCERWDRIELPKLEAAGWVVKTRNAEPRKARPYFDVILPSKKAVRHDGYLDMKSLKKIMGIKVAKYTPRWLNNDGLSFREHAKVWHSINTAGLSDEQVAMMRDADHDKYGSGHPAAMRMRY